MGGVLIVSRDPALDQLEIEFIGEDFLTVARRIGDFRRKIEVHTRYDHRNRLRETGEQDDPNKQDNTGGLRARIDPDMIPDQMRQTGEGEIPDYFAGAGQIIVSSRFKATVTELVGDEIQFIPVEVISDMSGGGTETRYLMFVNTVLNSLIEESGNFIVVGGGNARPGLRPEFFPLVLTMDDSFSVRASAITGHCLWRELRATNYLFASDSLLDSLTEKGLTGWDVSHRFDEI